jgi:hypothetical protein
MTPQLSTGFPQFISLKPILLSPSLSSEPTFFKWFPYKYKVCISCLSITATYSAPYSLLTNSRWCSRIFDAPKKNSLSELEKRAFILKPSTLKIYRTDILNIREVNCSIPCWRPFVYLKILMMCSNFKSLPGILLKQKTTLNISALILHYTGWNRCSWYGRDERHQFRYLCLHRVDSLLLLLWACAMVAARPTRFRPLNCYFRLITTVLEPQNQGYEL